MNEVYQDFHDRLASIRESAEALHDDMIKHWITQKKMDRQEAYALGMATGTVDCAILSLTHAGAMMASTKERTEQ